MSESRPLLPPGTWYQPGPAYLIRRADSFVVLTPAAPKPLLDAAWTVLGHGPASDGFLEALAREAGLESTDALGAVLFGTLGDDRTLLGVKGDTPLAAYTRDGRELVAAHDAPTITRREGVLRLAFGDLPAEQGPGVLALESGMVRIRGFVHMTNAAGELGEDGRDALAALVEEDGRSIEDPEVRRRREQNPPPARAPRTPPAAPVRPPAVAPRVAPPAAPAPVAPAPAAPAVPVAPERVAPNVFAELLGEPAPVEPTTVPSAETGPSAETARPAATPPPSAAPSAPETATAPDASAPEPAPPVPASVTDRGAPRRSPPRSSLFDRAAGSSATPRRAAPRPDAPSPAERSAVAPSLELTRDPSTLEFSPAEHSPPAPPPVQSPTPAPVAEAPTPAAASDQEPAASRPREDARSYDDLFGHTLHRRVEDAARPRHAEEPPAEAAGPVDRHPAPHVPALPEPDRSAPAAAPEPAPVPEFIDWVPGVRRDTVPLTSAPPPASSTAPVAPPEADVPVRAVVPSPTSPSGPSPASAPSPPVAGPAGSARPTQQPMTAPRAAVTVPALVCAAGHASPPDRDTCRVCGTRVGGPVRTVVRPPLGRLEISTGGTVTLDRTVVLGRRPRASRVGGDDVPLLVTVPSPQQDVSRSHLQIRPEGWHAVATDLATTNGTLLVRSQHETVRLRPHEAVVLADGDVLDLGDGVVLRWSEHA